MEEKNTICLKQDNIIRFYIQDKNGNKTGEYLEFNFEDLELPQIYTKIVEEDKKARVSARNKFRVIEKKEDHKGKNFFSANEEAKIKVLQEFYKKEEEIYDMFLGKNGVKKLLNGRKMSISTFDEIDDIIQNVILPKMQESTKKTEEKLMKKYNAVKKEEDTIE